MNTPTPRTDAAVKLTFAAGHNTVCPNFARELERELTALTAERDQLRAENATLRAATKACEACDEPTAFEVRQMRVRTIKAEANETVALANWNGALERSIKAEADLAALEQCHDDNCRALIRIAEELATERARLDAGTILLTVAGERVWHCGVDLRSAIDAGVKEGAK